MNRPSKVTPDRYQTNAELASRAAIEIICIAALILAIAFWAAP